MSRYGVSEFGTGVYGTTFDGVYDASPMNAYVADPSQGLVYLSWSIPNGEYTRLVLLRGKFGVPDNPDREVSVVLLDIDRPLTDGVADPSNDENYYYDGWNKEGTEAWYAIYVWAPDAEAAGGYRWYLAGSTGTVIPTNHNSADDLRSMLPRAFTSSSGGEVSGTEDSFQPLYKVMDGVGRITDSLRTDMDRILNIYDAEKCPGSLVPSMSAHLGIAGESALPTRVQRYLNKNAIRIFTSKGSSTSIRLMTESLSGLDASLTMNVNELPSPFLSGFEQSTDDISTGILSGPVSSASAVASLVPVTGRPGYPVLSSTDPAQLTLPPALGILRGSGGLSHALVLHRDASGTSSTNYTTVIGTKGTAPSGSFTTGDTLEVNHNGTGWSTSSGFVTEIEAVTGSPVIAVPFDIVTTEEALFTPLMDWRLKGTNVTTSPLAFTATYGPDHVVLWAEALAGENLLLMTEHSNTFLQGHVVHVSLPSLSIDGDFTITEILDPKRFTVSHTPVTDVFLSPTSVTENTVTGPEYARVLKVNEGEFYTASAWTHVDSAGRSVSLSIRAMDASLQTLGLFTSTTALTSGTWGQAVVSEIMPTGTKFASLEITVPDIPANGHARIDNVQFQYGSDATKYTDGSNVFVQLATSLVSDPNALLRLRLKDRLTDVTATGRTHTVLLTPDTPISMAANGHLSVPFNTVSRYFSNVDPTTTSADDLDLIPLTSDPGLSYLSGYSPELVFIGGTRETVEVVLRAAVTANGTTAILARQLSGIDPATDDIWSLSIVQASPTTATITATINNPDSDPATAITLSADFPYAAEAVRWYRMRLIASTSSGNLTDGATLGLYYAPDSVKEPTSWTLVDSTTAASAAITNIPGEIRVGDPTGGAAMDLYHARIGNIARFDSEDYSATTGTAPNDFGAQESILWSYTGSYTA